MPRYKFVCEPCEEHEEKIIREVFMSIKYFDGDGRTQICNKCGKEMEHILEMPAVHYKGKGFYTTDYPKKLPKRNEVELESELTQHYIDKAVHDGSFDEAREATETFVVDQYRNTETNEKVNVPVHVPKLEE